MSKQTLSLRQQTTTAILTPAPNGILQRKCACGSHMVAGGECARCAKSKSSLQRKLAIGTSNDPLEREADRVADQVIAAPGHSAVSSAPQRIQRYTGQATEGTDIAPASVYRVLASSGSPLEPVLLQEMEQRFGHDFSRVRVHSGVAAEHSAREVRANAYTVGYDIVFGAGRLTPGTDEGRRLLAHELTHVVQQRQSAPVVQRQPALEATEETEEKAISEALSALFDEFEKTLQRKPRESVKTWAHKYEVARRRLKNPAVPMLDVGRLQTAEDLIRIYGHEPPLPSAPETVTLPKGAVGANEILPFQKGQRVQITQLIGEFVGRYKSKILKHADLVGAYLPKGAEKSVPLLVDIFTDPDVSKSITAIVVESKPELFKADVDIPAIPKKAERPAYPPMKASLSLELNTQNEFDAVVSWDGGHTTFGRIRAKRGNSGEILVTHAEDPYTIALVKQPDGGLQVRGQVDVRDIISIPWSWKLDEPVFKLDPLKAQAGSAESIAEQSRNTKEALAQVRGPSRQDLYFSSGLQYRSDLHAVYSVGWRFKFSPLLDFIQLPLQLELEYSPNPDFFGAKAGFGIQTTLSSGKVPVTIRLIPGIEGGFARPESAKGRLAAERIPIFGPTFGLSGGLKLGSRVELNMDIEHFQNLVKDANRQGPSGVQNFKLGATFLF
jgi:hypothetical protein